MRILVLGAGGFIGRYLIAALLGAGHAVTAIVRRDDGLSAAFPDAEIRSCDLAGMTDAADWGKYLADIDIVVNSAGILRGPDMQAIHVDMPEALHRASADTGVQQVILISAISARSDVDTDYAQSKLAGEKALRSSALRWTILRPSLVYGEGSYGGTSLLRGLAGLPVILPQPGDGQYPFTPIHVEDLARAVVTLCDEIPDTNRVLEPVGPETMSVQSLLQRYRRWLNLGDGFSVSIPIPLMRTFARLGDILGRGPISSNSLMQMIAGNAGDSALFAEEIGFRPRSLDDSLRDHPAQVQDRWHARLFFAVPVLKLSLIILWVASALLGLLFGEAQTLAVLKGLGLPSVLAWPLQVGTAILDLAIAAFLMFEKGTKWSTVSQLVVVGGYMLVIGFAMPDLWLDPLGPLLKNLPILAAILIYGAIGSKR